jgi:hypothetical protein
VLGQGGAAGLVAGDGLGHGIDAPGKGGGVPGGVARSATSKKLCGLGYEQDFAGRAAALERAVRLGGGGELKRRPDPHLQRARQHGAK